MNLWLVGFESSKSSTMVDKDMVRSIDLYTIASEVACIRSVNRGLS